jgi:BirA family biotin operon repressor/biotin-[acetyl-CoA-carboxylase] ligase
MDAAELVANLKGLPLGAVRYFPAIGSTNTEAAGWADAGAPDLALVVADEQTAGRGRSGRAWFTPAGAALAFSLVLRPPFSAQPLEPAVLMARHTALGALAVCQALQKRYGLAAQIKWPNDVLLHGGKVCGVLAEAQWLGSQLNVVILGIGVNVSRRSVPPSSPLHFPAASIENLSGNLTNPYERWELLRDILEQMLEWKARLAADEFMPAWEDRLAFKNEWVWLVDGLPRPSPVLANAPALEARILGLDAAGGLRVEDRQGEQRVIRTGEMRLLPPAGVEPEA